MGTFKTIKGYNGGWGNSEIITPSNKSTRIVLISGGCQTGEETACRNFLGFVENQTRSSLFPWILKGSDPPIVLTVTLMFVNVNLHFFIGVLNPFHKLPHYQIPYIILLFMKHQYRYNIWCYLWNVRDLKCLSGWSWRHFNERVFICYFKHIFDSSSKRWSDDFTSPSGNNKKGIVSPTVSLLATD